jgi:beta-ribofuranosylaminobenzene 5'-phosphate synthase
MPDEVQCVAVTAPSRLHFGMFSFNDPARRQFGGAGVMIERPGSLLRITPASRLETRGPLAFRAERFARRWAEYHGVEAPRRLVEIVAAPPQHVGLGAGTQLAMAVGAGLNASCGYARMDAAELAACMGRGQRSAVGAYGFVRGGLIIEAGKTPGESVAPLVERIELPATWRFVLLRPRCAVGLSGEAERRAFRDLPPVPQPVTERLWEIARMRMAPAARSGDLAAFGESIYRFGWEAGMCFAPRQGGPFASPRLEEWAAAIREMGVAGVGQSSWGPTLFALLPDQIAAETFIQDFRSRCPREAIESLITPPNNSGASIEPRE